MDVMQAFLKPTKRVCFAPIVIAATTGPLSFEEVKELWYDRSELSGFKSRARKIVTESRLDNSSSNIDNLRGLEHCTAERQKHKVMSIQCTVSAFRRGLHPDRLASIAQRCTAWNSQNAFLQGCHDYCNVYNPAMANTIPQVTNIPPAQFPIAMRKRMVTDASASQHRRVRRRLNPILA